MYKIKLFFKLLLNSILYLLFPKSCTECNKIIFSTSSSDLLCKNCWFQLEFLTIEVCDLCSIPMRGTELQKENNIPVVCLNCQQSKPKFDQALSIFLYKGIIKKLIIGFKHFDKTNYSNFFANVIEQKHHNILKNSTCIIPVPINRRKMILRKYNQIALIINKLKKKNNYKINLELLKKLPLQKDQGNLTRKQRLRNIKSSIIVNPKYLSKIQGATITIIDDVHTTGATFNECAKVLKQAGAKKVYCISIARTAI